MGVEETSEAMWRGAKRGILSSKLEKLPCPTCHKTIAELTLWLDEVVLVLQHGNGKTKHKECWRLSDLQKLVAEHPLQ